MVPYPMAQCWLLFLLLVTGSTLPHGTDANSSPGITPCSNDAAIKRLCNGAASCTGRCGQLASWTSQNNTSQGQACNCDRNCRIFNDCCHDFEQACRSLEPMDSALRNLEEEDSICLGNFMVITTCRHEYVPSASILNTPVFAPEFGVHFISLGVLKCHLGDDTEFKPWTVFSQETEELSPGDVRSLLRGLTGSENRSEVTAVAQSDWSPRFCSMRVLASEECNYPPTHDCLYMSRSLVKSICTYITNIPFSGAFISPDKPEEAESHVPCKHLLDFPVSILSSNLDLNRYELYERQIDNESRALFVHNLNVPHSLNFWERLRCNVSFRNDSDVEFVVDKCDIISCKAGFFFIDHRCLIPEMLTVEIRTRGEANPYYDQNNMDQISRIVRVGTHNHVGLNLFSLGARVERLEDGSFALISHFSIREVRESDSDAILPLSRELFSILQNYDEVYNISGTIDLMKVCLLFNGNYKTLSRCDDIVMGKTIFPDVENYTLNSGLDNDMHLTFGDDKIQMAKDSAPPIGLNGDVSNGDVSNGDVSVGDRFDVEEGRDGESKANETNNAKRSMSCLKNNIALFLLSAVLYFK